MRLHAGPSIGSTDYTIDGEGEQTQAQIVLDMQME